MKDITKTASKPTNLFIIIMTFFFIEISIQYASLSSCAANQFYNYISHNCETCPFNNMYPSTVDKTFCNCSNTSYPNPNSFGFMSASSCLNFSAGQVLQINEVALLYNRDGSPLLTVSPQTCGGGSYPNADRTQCVPCGYNMKYNTNIGMCVCNDTNSYPVGGVCVSLGTGTGNPQVNNELDKLLYGIAATGCASTNPSKQACQILLNRCAESGFSGSNFCNLTNSKVSANIMNSYKGSSANDSIGIFASSVEGTDSTLVKNKLNFVVLEYDKFGKLRDIKPFGTQLLPCLATEEDVIKFQSFGLNLVKSCSSGDIQASNQLYYDIYVTNSDLNYVQVFTLYPSSSYFKRFYRKGFSTVQMSYKSIPPLAVPSIILTSSDSPKMVTSSKSDTINIVVLAPFIVFNVAVLVIFIINFVKYMKYNPNDNNDPYFCFKVIFLFFLMAIKHWGIALWIFLFGSSVFIFCFYKFQQTVYLLLPDIFTQWTQYYEPFMIVFYIQFGFVLVSVGLLIYELGSNIDYFMIDWQKQKNVSNYDIHTGKNKRQISVWRKVLLVNQLYQLTISQLVNTPFVILLGIFFIQGLKWINLSYQIPNINNVNKDYSTSSTLNVVLAYFIITFIFFIIALVMYTARFLLKTWNPMPYEDFVDLCCISNISLVIFDHDLHGYYLHGMNPLGRAEGTLGYIDSIFQKQAKSFGKSRAFRNDDPSQTQTFQVCFPTQIRQAFQMKYKNRYLQKLVGRAYDTSVFSKPIPEMLDQNDYKEIETIQNDMLDSFKYYLQGVKTSQFNVRERTFLENLVSCPIDKEYMGRLPIFFKDFWYQFTKVLLMGHEFLLLINTINFINIFYIATKSVVIACLITMVICRIVIKNIADLVIKRNISRNTLIDDKFFA